MEVRPCAVKSRAVWNRNCVAAMRGGEQREKNDQSVTRSRYTETGELDSAGMDGRACERMAKPAKRAIGEEPNRRASGLTPDDMLVVGDGMAGSPGAEIRETRQCWRVRRGQESACLAGGSQSVRSSDEAGNDRGAKGTQEGGRMKDGMTDDKPARVPARAHQRWNTPRAIDLAGTESPMDILGDECEKPLPLVTRTHQLESRMRENRLSGLEGGGAFTALPTPICRFEPGIDYVVTKIPRFAFEKCPQADPTLTT